MRTFLLLFLMALFSFSSNSQPTDTAQGKPALHRPSAWNSFWNLSGPERGWVITHLFIANKARKISLEARALSEEIRKDTILDGDSDGGRVDAFRHTYWMARLSQTFCWKKAIKLGKAHEKGNYKQYKKGKKDEEGVLPDSVSSAMDLFNNSVGASIGCANPFLSKKELQELVIQLIIVGKTKIISKNNDGIPLDCNGKLIETDVFFNRWNIPKCLVNSGF